ncbi:MAG: 4-hydroxy-tetrahydrodipicolinate reductase [bacterium]|nr:4-hydroxy-tetrahydrodipicolinate reductase [bacterium]
MTEQSSECSICVVGAAGRMGQRVIACARTMPVFRIVGAVEAPTSPALGRDAGVHAGCEPLGVTVSSDLAGACAAATVVIDFALAEGFAARVETYARLGKACVLGTTGVDAAGRAAVARAAERVPVVHAPNFSVGVNLLCALTRYAAAILGEAFDVEIVEMHHRQKKDAPSGTAVRLAEMVDAGRGTALHRVFGREGICGTRAAGELAIHAVRGGDVVGDHTVIFAGEGERVELTHKASSRDTFARGALRAALFVARAAPGAYSMSDVLGLADLALPTIARP